MPKHARVRVQGKCSEVSFLAQALVLASSVRMQHPLSNTPAIFTPPPLTPAAADEPGATPLADTPLPPNSVSASGAPFVQKKRAGLHRALLESAFHAAANQAAQLDLVLLLLMSTFFRITELCLVLFFVSRACFLCFEVVINLCRPVVVCLVLGCFF